MELKKKIQVNKIAQLTGHKAGQFIEVIEDRQGLKIGCIEEVAWEMDFIDDAELEWLGNKYFKSGYGEYLLDLLRK